MYTCIQTDIGIHINVFGYSSQHDTKFLEQQPHHWYEDKKYESVFNNNIFNFSN